MIIAFVTDIHINFSKDADWEKQRLQLLTEELNSLEADTLLFGGDVFDVARPSLEELKAFYSMVAALKDKYFIMVISGNHENLDNNISVFDLIPETDFVYYKNEEVKYEGHRIHLVSHNQIHTLNKKRIPKNCYLFSHIRCSGGVYKEEISFDFTKHYEKVFLGDIHSRTTFDNVEYPSSPYSHAYDTPRQHGVLIVDFRLRKVSVEYKELFLPCKILLKTSLKELENTLKICEHNPLNKYKIELPLTAEDVKNLPKLSNVQYRPLIRTTTVELEEETVEQLKVAGRLDIPKVLLELTIDHLNGSDNMIKIGNEVLEGIVYGKNK